MTIYVKKSEDIKLIKKAGPNRVNNKKAGQRLQLKKMHPSPP